MEWFFLILNWVLYLLIFFMAGHFLRLAFLVGRKGRNDLIRTFRGKPLPADQSMRQRFVALNIIAALALFSNGICVLLFAIPMSFWSGIGALILWFYFSAMHLLSWRSKQLERLQKA